MLALGLCCLAVACGSEDDDAATPALQRLELSLANGETSWPRARAVATLDLSALLDNVPGDGPWRIDAPEHRSGYLTGHENDPTARVLWLLAPNAESHLRLVYGGPIDPTAFNEVRLRFSCGGPGDVGAELYRDGQPVGIGPRVQLVQSPELRDVVLSMPPHFTDRNGADVLAISFSSSARRVGLSSIELLQRPPEAWLPDPKGGARLISVDGDARRGVGLSTRRPVETTVAVPRNARLSFSYAQLLESGHGGNDLQLVLEIESPGGTLTERHGFPTRDWDWREVEVDLSDLAGSQVRIGFRLEADAGTLEAAALAELSLWVPRRRPASLLLITSDTHRYDHIGVALPDNEVSTPVFDALAGRGVFFERCFSTTNVTNPSHMAMLTGVHPRDLGIHHNNLPLNGSAATLAEELAARGWLTHAVLGARHLGHPSSGLGQGFDRIDWPVAGERDVESSLAIVEDWLRQAEDRPLFLWLHLFDVHGPYKPPRIFRRLYWPDDRDPFDPSLPDPGVPDSVLPEILAGLRDLSWPLAAYRGEVSWLDSSLAGLLTAPRFASGVVALTADHGESFGQHGVWYGHAGLYPDSIHVPLILSWPGAPAGRRVTAPVSQIDLAATLLELSGVGGHDLPGQSFASLAAAGGTTPETPRFALAAHRFSASVTSGRWHLILHLMSQHQRNMTSSFALHQVELYDLDADLACTNDLSVVEHDETARLRGRLITWLKAAADKGWAGQELDDPVRLEELRALGYLAVAEPASSALWIADDCERCAPFTKDDP
jgi:arylsulfatase